MLLLIDNFDSFSYILADLIRQTGEELKVVRNDISVKEVEKISFDGLILSPGPGIPKNAGNLMDIFERYYQKVPVLGVCLGHQAIGEFFGAKIIKNDFPTHGKVREVRKIGDPIILKKFPESFKVTRYHSLQLEGLPVSLIPILETESHEIMGIQHESLPILGVQYHPEALLSEYGLELIQAWLGEFRK
ncbi:anthranilate synthase component II [Algoriphagus zhangzhouensis]|uniref:Anthranilate synthase component 2 n=1 Tax=Algoriphagus zhangzhouensis TaxID=1073327 RepID=A0A1M7ZG39_9BACT|nr:aminodeoxychorismate/anthranilate synthase component II [Algoriphagus zhangzhouensis]TDY44907.1 anthranilate synthase component 2 [Algoriphagus zhangzhouensis]SHO63802.1 anthranilate synthase component 2 [Algoriphagus zhangzhouensis]